ncbi:putative pentatricopeptide repeat-containing protein At3g18840 [Spinacia oleracea]|uniref:Pentatricopeptide repeat-containing protein At3g18840 n=1 Tax=Spinacia oleracea TaxID=3562 RepID=A0A9R0K9E7_SPIOL|nr:putative pentatricopeptide repeat-containing protein At3g18840 [Spinacia oleracea]XP_021863501.1 putative pentatricopeptide repeat-containing protein At3g18840 [Spinacia oleracea]XP_056682744.1 putative pentatricopeptide repeat-containing protein At3g18840 [Spinacia oleracea]XP_056682745.1 putative pentatricopeptide repeat-containing protein At3g18840 [Spinacia oleracea]XP_056682746.1 putative pentatricopeptide repeat-containing protein At3g18840 [Spinacia oleracea]
MHLKSLKEVLLFHSQAIKSGFQSIIFTTNQLIHYYAKNGFLRHAHKLFDEMPERNVYSWNTIIAAHLKNHDLKKAEFLFNSSPHKDLVTYNSMLAGYVNNVDDKPELEHERSDLALRLFVEMQSSQIHGGSCSRIDEFTVTTMLNLVAKLCFVSLGTQLHSYMVKSGNVFSGFSCSSLIDMYSKCGCFREAIRVFNECRGCLDSVSKNAIVAACCRESELDLALDIFWHEVELNDTISWNTIISGFVQNGFHEKAFRLFICMMENGIRLNNHTFASILGACSSMRNLKLGKEIHAHVLKAGFIENSFISSGVVDVYCKCGNMDYAKFAYTTSSIGNAFSISSMIVAYSLMGNMEEARRLFDTLIEQNTVVWTALFSGYVKSQCCEEAFNLLSEFLAKEANVIPDALILMSMLGACAIQASLHPGKQIHSYILKSVTKIDGKLLSSMIDMYSKCGHITYAERIFLQVKERDSVLYNVMITGYAHHGKENEAIMLFKEMCERDNIRPNAATFVALLSTCRHAGLVELGENYFHAMESDYGIQPEADHYACMIDLYGRANQLEKASALMERVPFEPDAVLLGAFLNACRINRNLELAREAEEKLLRIEGESGSRYVQLANVYASEGNWVEVGRIRKKMKGKEVKKLAGCSWIHLENGVTIFTSGDTSHLKSDAIYSLLACLVAEINHLAVVERSKALA